jgi:shikimate kinase
VNRPVAVLIGPPGAGKSTVGPLLAALLGAEFVETDQMVEEAAGKPVSDIFVTDGEPAFRDLERAAVARALDHHSGIVALGGGAVMDPQTRERLDRHRVVYLQTGFAAAVRRVGLDSPRPMLIVNPRGRMRELLAERLPVYESLARITVATDDRDPQEIADEIAAAVTARIAAAAGEGAGTGPEDGEWAGEWDDGGDTGPPPAPPATAP